MVAGVALQALVVLGCPVAPDGTPGPAARRRLERAVLAYRDLPVPLVLSGGRAWGGAVEAVAFRAWLVARSFVPRGATLVECRSLSTGENARFSAALLEERGIDRVGVITCDWHMPRVLRAFARTGLSVVAIPASSPSVGPVRRGVRTVREWVAQPVDDWCTWGWEVA